MKSLTNYINEKLIVNKNYNPYTYAPKSFDELRNIVIDRYNKLGAGTKQNPIDFNDIDVSNLDSFYNNNDMGLFEGTKFKHIDISGWDVSNVTDMSCMFLYCKALKTVGDLSKWDVSKVTNMGSMFFKCEKLESVGDISKWDVSKVTNMEFMFCNCESFNQDIYNWNVSSVISMDYIFWGCPLKNEYKPKFK